jgi:uncharacterized protein YdiU (UPF0061 family)
MASKNYKNFDKIDGSHPIKENIPNARVEYQARYREGGKLFYFNYELAKEMGLIPKNHEEKMNKELSQKIMNTFSLIIINEFDIENNIEFDPNTIKPNTYMATRYLQLQHTDKKGYRSGDGRSIWNGQFSHRGKSWDISSSGSGATKLSPATSKFGRFFQSGDPTISYGCGYAELDEGLATLMFSEIFNKNNIKTERVLAIIEYPDNIAVTVRAHDNLLRPSHLFAPLKQGNLKTLKRLMDYYIAVEKESARLKISSKFGKYDSFLRKVVEDFARMAARFEDEYIFCWLDWDGDNILMNGGIIDYGSIRQFGMYHHEYRYDDDDRYSTTISEQKQKAKHMCQTFAQMIDFVKTGEKKAFSEFKKHWSQKMFDAEFEKTKNHNILYKIGFKKNDISYLRSKHSDLILVFRKVFSYFERATSTAGMIKTPDGITQNAIFCMRDILRELPQLYMAKGERLDAEEFIEVVRSSYALKEDLLINEYRRNKIKEFQDYYLKLIDLVAKSKRIDRDKQILEIMTRSFVINRYDRVTGDALSYIIDDISKSRKKFSLDDLFLLIKDFCKNQNFDPENRISNRVQSKKTKKTIEGFREIIVECREGI